MRFLLVAAMAVAAFNAFSTSGASAQEPDAEFVDAPQSSDMWFYKHIVERYDDPKMSVRRKAEFRGLQRQSRIAALKWYGMSNSRPHAAPHPYTSVYSPTWHASRLRPYAWYTTGRSPVVVSYSQRVFR